MRKLSSGQFAAIVRGMSKGWDPLQEEILLATLQLAGQGKVLLFVDEKGSPMVQLVKEYDK